MDMVVNQQVRTPGVQDGEQPDLRTETIGVAGHLEQRLGAGIEEQIEEGSGRSHPQRVQFVGQREDDMKVVRVDQIALLKLEPSPACMRLAFRTAPRSAGVVRHGGFVRTALTLIPVPAESSRPATLHCPVCLQMLITEARPIAFQKLSALAMSDRATSSNGRLPLIMRRTKHYTSHKTTRQPILQRPRRLRLRSGRLIGPKPIIPFDRSISSEAYTYPARGNFDKSTIPPPAA
jgi:hypothetical protein